jgi:hypothetical protein
MWKIKNNKPFLLICCIVFSLLFHLSILVCLNKHSFSFHTKTKIEKKSTVNTPLTCPVKLALGPASPQIVKHAPPTTLPISPKLIPISPPKTNTTTPPSPNITPPPKSNTTTTSVQNTTPPQPTIKNHVVKKKKSLKKISTLMSHNISINNPIIKELKDNLPPLANYPSTPITTPLAAPQKESIPLPLASFPLPNSSLLSLKSNVPPSFTIKSLNKNTLAFSPTAISMPSLQLLSTLSCGQDFETHVIYTPHEQGFLFAVTLIPLPDNNFKRIKKNVIFLVDHSNSIQKKRLDLTRQAISSAILSLDKKDKFNIVSFAHNPTIFSPRSLHPTKTNITAARRFLRNINIGSFFYSANLFLPFKELLSNPNKKDELNIAILLTDGEDINKIGNQRILEQWTKVNKGNLSLYTIALNDDNNRAALEFFSTINKGKIAFAKNPYDIKRKLIKLLNTISFPIAKNISSHPISKNKNNKIQLFSTQYLPNIYLNEPFVILGKINKLEDFTLFLQGIHANNWFNIKKDISFVNATEDKYSLLQEWAILQAYDCYHHYLINGNEKYIDKAKILLDPFNLDTAFQQGHSP